jgi:hypothetical protein
MKINETAIHHDGERISHFPFYLVPNIYITATHLGKKIVLIKTYFITAALQM